MKSHRLLLVVLLVLVASPIVVAAAEKDPSRELSNLSVMGVDKLRAPTHRENFGMIQYMPDPIQGFNRGSFKITKPVIHWVMRPAAKGWRFVVPTLGRRGLENFAYNIAYPARFLSLLLQARPVKAGVETGHFIVNTTLGVAGFVDVATPIGIPTYRQDVGMAFARWGMGHGFYFFIPFMGPSSGRDGLARLFDMALTPVYLVPGLSWLLNINAFSFRIDGYEALEKSESDLYLPVRALWAIQREIAVQNYRIPPEAYETSDPEPSLGVLLLKVQDPKFPPSAREHRVQVPTTGRELPYSLWLQDKPAPLVYIIPGVGAHRNSSNPVALAEMAFARGYSTVTVSSPFQEEFLLNGLSVPYPGYTPSDAEDLYTALSRIHRDLATRYPGRVTAAKLMGYSLGAIETVFIAGAQKHRPPDALRFDRFVAINPPVDLRYAARGFDAYFDAPLEWPEGERDQRVKELAMKAFLVVQEGLPEGKGLPLDRAESEFLIGFSGRTMMVNALAAIRAKGGKPLPIRPEDRDGGGPLLDVINQSSLYNYGQNLIIPYYLEKRGHRIDGDELAREAGLHGQEETLRSNEKLRIFTNANDFILGQENLAWLREVSGDKLVVFPDGGHLGNMHLAPVQAAVFGALRTAVEERAALEATVVTYPRERVQ